MSEATILREKPPDRITLTLTGKRGLIPDESTDGYHGSLIVRKGPKEVRLRITTTQYETLSAMGMEEWT